MAPFKFNFVPERQLFKPVYNHSAAFVKIYPAGTLVFNPEIIRLYEMKDKFIKLFADKSKRAIGWQLVEGNTVMEDLTHQIKLNKSGIAVVGIRKVLESVGAPKTGISYPRMEVKTYKGPLDSGVIYYAILPDVEHETNAAPEKVNSENSGAQA